jgi:hypothetical protein
MNGIGVSLRAVILSLQRIRGLAADVGAYAGLGLALKVLR